MTKRMLIDATHAEETRVVVLDGDRLEDFDVETSTKRQLKGNIYLAKVVRVEPSLQAAFVEYGGGRHGFLAFAEIHPDYYQIPVADRERLIAAQEAEALEDEAEEDRAAAADEAAAPSPPDVSASVEPDFASSIEPEAIPTPYEMAEAIAPSEDDQAHPPAAIDTSGSDPEGVVEAEIVASSAQPLATPRYEFVEPAPSYAEPAHTEATSEDAAEPPAAPEAEPVAALSFGHDDAPIIAFDDATMPERDDMHAAAAPIDDAVEAKSPDATESPYEQPAYAEAGQPQPPEPAPDVVGGDSEDRNDRRPTPRFLRNYKIQEVIKRRQILLIQVVKEERGTKGAALTTYISLAGRFSVLMPNSPRGGGISRKITSAADRRRLKEVTSELDLPRGMGLIVRTAGAQRPKPEIKRDCEYLMRLWDEIRDQTMRSVAPALIYEEASLIKRAIRDVYSRDIEDIQVDGEAGWRAARDFMRMLMPAHAKKVQLWSDSGQKLFARHQVDAQLDAMLEPTVQLKSGGYLVINQTEALVAIDVNSGRSTRERNIEETAFRTNMEAAEEAARQLRLRDLAGLIVIDFIDMERRGNNAAVEKKLKDALKDDRARIQLGSISHFGLMEMSRQRLRPSLAETALVTCPHCAGSGHVRSTESAAIAVLRAIEEEGGKRRSAEIMVHVATSIAMYLFNHKRDRLADIERRYGLFVTFAGDDSLRPPDLRIERVRAPTPGVSVPVLTHDMSAPQRALDPAEAADLAQQEDADLDLADDDAEEEEDDEADVKPRAEGATPAEGADPRGKRRRRRRGGRGQDRATETLGQGDAVPAVNGVDAGPMADHVEGVPEATVADPDAPTTPASDQSEEARARRRGRRGGRRRRRDEGPSPEVSALGADQPEFVPVSYAGPTPADPFGGGGFDIFDVLDRVEQDNERRPAPSVVSPLADPETAPTDAEQAAELQAPAFGSPEVAPPEPVPARADAGPVTAVFEAEAAGADLSQAPALQTALDAISVAPPEPEPEAEPEPALGSQPTLIGTDTDAAAQKRKGWWRR